MSLPLFDEPRVAIERIGIVNSPEWFAYWVGFRQGADGQSVSFRYDDDERVDEYYKTGHRIGRLFRPLACVQK